MESSLSRNFHPKLKVEISADKLKALVNAIVELSSKGEIRQGIEKGIQVYSIFDTIANAVGKKSQREVWKRVSDKYPEVVTICDNYQFPGKGQRKTPVTDLVGLIEIVWVLPGEFSAKLRRLGAEIIAEIIPQLAANANTEEKTAFLLERIQWCDRLLERMELKLNFVDVFDICRAWKVQPENANYFLKENGEFDYDKFEYYEAGLVNQEYAAVAGSSKKKLCEDLGIPYHRDITPRDFMPTHVMESLRFVEEMFGMFMSLQKMTPDDAMDEAVKFAKHKFRIPHSWERQKSITCPPAQTAEEFKDFYLQKRHDYNLQLATLERQQILLSRRENNAEDFAA